jgi:hypothetical protein
MAPAMNWAQGYLAATALVCLLVFRVFYRSEFGPRPVVATGCAVLTFIVCLLGGLYLAVMGAIGGSFGF